MADPYLVDLQPDDPPEFRRLVIQRWYKNVATNFKTVFAGSTPLTGDNLVDITPDNDRPSAGCAQVAWVRNASQQLP